jgi:dimethylhistidine N-methyltransferase
VTIKTAVSDRFELITVPRSRGVPSFAQDVASGLRARPKRLSSKYLYDEVGSALFDAITHLPEYYLTRAETEILSQWGWQIVRVLDAPLDFVELGSGSAIKTRLLIGEALRVQHELRYSPIDISTEAIRASSMALVESYPALSVRAYAGDYFDVLGSHALVSERKMLAMFMGSNIGNYEPDEAKQLLSLLGGALRAGDGLLLGADLKKDAATLVLARINRELEGAFDLGKFGHVVHYDEVRGSVDSFLEARERVSVPIRSLGMRVAFAAGERIHMESSYKFTDDEIAALGGDAGFRQRAVWHDRGKRFSVQLLVKA